MLKTVDYMELGKLGNYILVDVRSPGEFLEYHIPGSINLPLFNDEERRIIGTAYHQESIDIATKLGLEYAAAKLPRLYEEFYRLKGQYKNIALMCERGGMRSTSVCSLLDSIGFNAVKLRGGYKGYRGLVNQSLPALIADKRLVVLHGLTGVGKTDLLKKLEGMGFDVLDLEQYANHRGSLLGSVGLGACRSQKQFEAEIFERLLRVKSKYIFIEAESSRIGNIVVPQFIMKAMAEGFHILVESSIEARAERLVAEYGGAERVEEILSALDDLGKYISHENICRYKQMVESGDLGSAAIELMARYYDPMYAADQRKYSYELIVDSDDLKKAASDIERWLRNLLPHREI